MGGGEVETRERESNGGGAGGDTACWNEDRKAEKGRVTPNG